MKKSMATFSMLSSKPRSIPWFITYRKPHSSQEVESFKISLWNSSLLLFRSFEKLIMGMLLYEDFVILAGVGLSAMSRTNLSGMAMDLAFLNSWTSLMWPSQMGVMCTGAMVTEFEGHKLPEKLRNSTW
ncbi:hypothetical protein F0562_000235 [Nyssa sinensis]|uniref:Uncharacterized protein n=1 Tax=Nyssa sinensis TaxID=561372 RepID=A0A5J5BZW7_9ASTE|nr:hypothetical protein F0562_000235 [Nyssa sinensis]